jgi:AraC-like DNA-binding protein
MNVKHQAKSSSKPGGGAELIPDIRPYVRHCGHETRPPWRIESRKLLDFLLVYIASGNGEFEIARVTTPAGPGDLFWIPPDTPHTMESSDPAMELAYVHFDLAYRPELSHWDFSIPGGMLDLSGLLPLMHPRVPNQRLRKLCGKLHGYTNERVGLLLKEICAEAVRAQPYGIVRMSGLMMEVIAEILRGQEGLLTSHAAHIPVLEKAAHLLQQHCHETHSLDTIARQHGLSPSHFRQLFHTHFRCSPRTYLRKARIEKSCRLMMGSAMTLSQIASSVGFESIHSFSKAFHETEGITPSEYRRAGKPYTRVSGRSTPPGN